MKRPAEARKTVVSSSSGTDETDVGVFFHKLHWEQLRGTGLEIIMTSTFLDAVAVFQTQTIYVKIIRSTIPEFRQQTNTG